MKLNEVISARRVVWLTATLAIMATVGGCAAMRAAAARQQYIHGQTQNYTYKRPIGQVWPNARTLLFENNYEVKNTGEAGVYTLETEWAYDGNRQTRYLVQGIVIDDQSCQVHFTKITQYTGQNNNSSGRDLDMEWFLLKQMDPTMATEIEAGAEEASKQAG